MTVTRRLEQADTDIRSDQADVDVAYLGQGQQREVGQRVVEARTAERTEDGDRRRATSQGSSHGQFGIRFVLVEWRSLDGDPFGFEGGDPLLAERVAITHPAVDPEAQRRGVPRSTVRRHDVRIVRTPAWPGDIDGVARTDSAVGEDDGLRARVHGVDASGLPPTRC
jgi:hypothetical protein